VALSGGADSVCLLSILKGLGYKIRAAHVNHMLRGNAIGDEEYVNKLCIDMGIEIDTAHIDVAAYAKEHAFSIETAGRIKRYEFLQDLAKKYDGIIATAHNLSDSAESVIMHLMRGSGMKGLVGIRSKIVMGEAVVVRPLIETERRDIEEYCRVNNLDPRHDETNDTLDYARNDVRHNIMPLFSERSAVKSIVRTGYLLSADEEFLEDLVGQIFKKNVRNGTVAVEFFNSQPLAMQRRLIRLMIKPFEGRVNQSFQLVHIDAVIEMAGKNYGGKYIEFPGGVRVKIEGGRLFACDK